MVPPRVFQTGNLTDFLICTVCMCRLGNQVAGDGEMLAARTCDRLCMLASLNTSRHATHCSVADQV
jgi:hypothetical protein